MAASEYYVISFPCLNSLLVAAEFYVICYVINFYLLLTFLIPRYANLILNLFALMVDANVPDIALEPDKTVKKVLKDY